MVQRQTISEVVSKKQRGERIVMLTAYDYPMAVLLDRAGVDIVLVGDSLANVALGLESTTQIGMEGMLHHAKAVVRGVDQAIVIADMPFEAYQVDRQNAVFHARRFLFEAGCQGIKVEWFSGCLEVVGDLRAASIPVMGHVGLTPQTATDMKVQGREEAQAKKILSQARALEAAGCFAVVLECIPQDLAHQVTESLNIPTIGIGAGPHCDGQVLVTNDMLGLNDRKVPKFVRQYGNLGQIIVETVRKYKDDVGQGLFPADSETFH
ncbi:MAG: 3-methyl-2-oxobutanoate hydroxymethyltransferase [Candidatus Omnitrophica bacterium]|nr:3-methyl-2-oxobutanoate hydroxymethyltransferase [Candidatus Omnitrophota bacterium]